MGGADGYAAKPRWHPFAIFHECANSGNGRLGKAFMGRKGFSHELFTPHMRCVSCGFLSLSRCSYVRFRSDERVSFGIAPKETKRSSPGIRPQLRWGSLAPSLLRGHAAMGHPWPIAALAASMPLNPLHNDSGRPPEGAIGVACSFCGMRSTKKAKRPNGRFRPI